MRWGVSSLFYFLFDALLPPRPSEHLVRSLSVENLRERSLPEHNVGLLPYHDPAVRALVWELKYYARAHAADLAGALLAERLFAIATEEIGRPLLIPTPMHDTRRRVRGHNQTELLCTHALTQLKTNASGTDLYTYAPNALVRVTYTKPQQGLPRHRRVRNVANTMRVAEPAAVKNKVCVVVDDVTTTGATLAETKRALEAAGALRVVCVALAQ